MIAVGATLVSIQPRHGYEFIPDHRAIILCYNDYWLINRSDQVEHLSHLRLSMTPTGNLGGSSDAPYIAYDLRPNC